MLLNIQTKIVEMRKHPGLIVGPSLLIVQTSLLVGRAPFVSFEILRLKRPSPTVPWRNALTTDVPEVLPQISNMRPRHHPVSVRGTPGEHRLAVLTRKPSCILPYRIASRESGCFRPMCRCTFGRRGLKKHRAMKEFAETLIPDRSR